MPLYEIIPLEAVVGTCCVLDLYTYCKGKETERAEKHVAHVRGAGKELWTGASAGRRSGEVLLPELWDRDGCSREAAAGRGCGRQRGEGGGS